MSLAHHVREIIAANQPWCRGNAQECTLRKQQHLQPCFQWISLVRQKSLITPRTTTSILNRPLTAEPHTTQLENPPTQPPSPYKKAWASGTPSPMVNNRATCLSSFICCETFSSNGLPAHSFPQVRPLSAGPFHKPDTSSLGRTMEDPATITTSTTQTTILSTAPLIEAIQTELRKFNRYDDSQ